MSSQLVMEDNIARAGELVKQAVTSGAEFVCLPENVAYMSTGADEASSHSYAMGDHPALVSFQRLAKNLKVWLSIGSLYVSLPESEKMANRSVLLDDQGRVRAVYDKMHLFDVDIEGGEAHRESDSVQPGDHAVVAQLPWCEIGLSICYDVRFPELYRQMALAGAKVMLVPAAFTAVTGEAHWEVLLRARAIETGSFVVAAAQVGHHPYGRRTYGHALIVDPWGRVLADGGDKEGVIVADIDPNYSDKVRGQLPNLQHGRHITISRDETNF